MTTSILARFFNKAENVTSLVIQWIIANKTSAKIDNQFD